ncbi:hypothetical protein KBB08_01000 [Candidatus Gracilibacteria bacterium]|nr:hypothetical protein [Candidatus Gracilibacteria bacterium]
MKHPEHALSHQIKQGKSFHVYLLYTESPDFLRTNLEQIVTELKGGVAVDHFQLAPLDGSIDVDATRVFRKHFQLQAVTAMRIGVIEQIDLMTLPAQQMLLKLLEEAPANTIFLLTTTRIRLVSKPLLSRVSVWRLGGTGEVAAIPHADLFDQLLSRELALFKKQPLIDKLDKQSTWSAISRDLSLYLWQHRSDLPTVQKWLFTLSLAQSHSKVKPLLEYFFLTGYECILVVLGQCLLAGNWCDSS